MPTARADSYIVPSGGTLFAGGGLPAWLPAVGAMGPASTNKINDVKGGDSSTASIFVAWSGCAWAPWWGAYGSMIFTGGGHTDGSENTIYRYDVESRLVSKIKSAATVYTYDDGGGAYVADQTTGWMWANGAGSAVQTGEPFTAHFYAYLMALPSAAMSGGATNGWLYTPGRNTMPTPGQRGTTQGHKLRLGLDTTWGLQGTPTGWNAGYGCAAYDSIRNRVWVPRDDATALRWRDLDDDTSGTLSHSGSTAVGYYCIAEHYVAEDVLMLARMNAGLYLRVIDLSTGVIYAPSASGTAPSDSEGAWAWSETWEAWAYYPRAGGATVYFLKAPANPRTGTWVWSSQTLSGTSYASDGSTPAYNRLRHCAALGNLLLWAPSYNQPIQALRVEAP